MKKMKPSTSKLSKTLLDAANRHHKNNLLDGMNDELKYCKKMVESGHKNPHWAIRVAELTEQLNTKKRKKK